MEADMKTFQLKSEIGQDGVLALHIPFGTAEAGQKVTVTIQQTENSGNSLDANDSEWRQILKETYGAGEGLGLARQDQGKFSDREPIE
jgi:hypothetical protein